MNSVWQYLAEPVNEIPRACLPDELAEFIALHDQLLSADMPGVALVLPTGEGGEASAAVACLLFPLGHDQNRVIASLYCAGHIPGAPLSESIDIGLEVECRIYTDAEPGEVWGVASAKHIKPTIH